MVNEMITHLEKLWCALFVSEGWYESWRRFKDYPLVLSEGCGFRQHALKCKTVGIIEFDRILNGYETSMKMDDAVPEMFIYGDDE
jgi:hypothetical protein